MKPAITLKRDGFGFANTRHLAEWQRQKPIILAQVGEGFKTHFRESRLSGPPGVTTKTGTFARSHGHHVKVTGTQAQLFTGFYGEPGRRARLLEYGGTIFANGRASKCGSGKYLAIPLRSARTAAGYQRQGPCEYSDLKIIPGRKPQTWLLVREVPNIRGQIQIIPMFLLVRFVVVKARLGFYPAWRAYYAEKAKPYIWRAVERIRSSA